MFDPRRNRIRKSDSKSKPNPDPSQSFLSTKKALQKLSLSFYGLDTIKKTKQIILDDCQIYQGLPQVNSLRQRITQDKKRHKENMRGMTVNKDTTLKIDTLFMDEKLDEFQFVTTNASQLDHRDRPQTKKKVSRSNSVKVKDNYNQRNRKDIMMMDVYSARCKTAKCLSRKGKVPEKKLKKK